MLSWLLRAILDINNSWLHLSRRQLQDADLSFEISGQVIDVEANEGDLVETGQVLVRLDSTNQEKAVAQAEAGVTQAKAALVSAQARLDQARTGPTDEAIKQAEAAVDTAKNWKQQQPR